MDKVIEIQKPGIDEVNQYWKAFYGNDHSIVNYTHDYSMCDIQEICLRNKDNPEKAVLELSSHLHVAS